MKEKLVPTTQGAPGRRDVFLDDLQTIHAILGRFGTVGIETERFDDVALEDLADFRHNVPTELSMWAYEDVADGYKDTKIRVEMKGGFFTVWVTDSRPELVAAKKELLEVPRRRPPPSRTQVGGAIGVVLCVALLWAASQNLINWTTALILGPLSILFSVVFVGGQRKKADVQVHFYPSFDHSTFWSRNREALAVNIAVGVVFFAAGIVATLAIQQLTSR